jgi:3-hydroxybutyryl-CoA dehydratase
MRFSELTVGQSAEMTKTVMEDDITSFARVSGDYNPLHLDEEAAKQTMFGGRIAHGMLAASVISAAIGMKLPGPGAIYMSQSLRFTKPVRIGETVTARVEIVEIIAPKKRVRLTTTCRNRAGELVIEGEALVMVPDG